MDDLWEEDSGEHKRSLVDAQGSVYAPLNSTYIEYLVLGAAAVIFVGYGLYHLALTGDPFQNKNSQGGDYYDPDLASAGSETAEAAFDYAAATESAKGSEEYRRKRAAYDESKLSLKVAEFVHLHTRSIWQLKPKYFDIK